MNGIEELRELAGKSNKKWNSWNFFFYRTTAEEKENDTAYVVAAANAVPELLDEIELLDSCLKADREAVQLLHEKLDIKDAEIERLREAITNAAKVSSGSWRELVEQKNAILMEALKAASDG